MDALKARDLAKDAGCAVGAIYSHFDDLNALILAVNGRTFQRLGEEVAASQSGHEGPPTARLVSMGQAYLRFADRETNLWRALFDVEMAADGPVPAWYLDALGNLFSHIAEPLAELHPAMDAVELDLLTRALFSSVHGIVLLGLERRISGVPVDQIDKMIAQIVSGVGNI